MPWQVYNSAGQLLQATDLPDNAVTNAKVADDAIGVAELSATGTASSSVFLRGDNAWAAAGGSDISARVYGVAQAASNDAWLTILFNAEHHDTDTMHGTSTDQTAATGNSKLTAITAGVYVISGSITFDGNATGQRLLRILVNGSTHIAYVSEHPESTDAVYMNISTIYKLDADDYVQLLAFQDSGSALNVRRTANISPEFAMVKI